MYCLALDDTMSSFSSVFTSTTTFPENKQSSVIWARSSHKSIHYKWELTPSEQTGQHLIKLQTILTQSHNIDSIHLSFSFMLRHYVRWMTCFSEYSRQKICVITSQVQSFIIHFLPGSVVFYPRHVSATSNQLSSRGVCEQQTVTTSPLLQCCWSLTPLKRRGWGGIHTLFWPAAFIYSTHQICWVSCTGCAIGEHHLCIQQRSRHIFSFKVWNECRNVGLVPPSLWVSLALSLGKDNYRLLT